MADAMTGGEQLGLYSYDRIERQKVAHGLGVSPPFCPPPLGQPRGDCPCPPAPLPPCSPVGERSRTAAPLLLRGGRGWGLQGGRG